MLETRDAMLETGDTILKTRVTMLETRDVMLETREPVLETIGSPWWRLESPFLRLESPSLRETREYILEVSLLKLSSWRCSWHVGGLCAMFSVVFKRACSLQQCITCVLLIHGIRDAACLEMCVIVERALGESHNFAD
jgi:hypothetical protein